MLVRISNIAENFGIMMAEYCRAFKTKRFPFYDKSRSQLESTETPLKAAEPLRGRSLLLPYCGGASIGSHSYINPGAGCKLWLPP